MGDNRAWEAFYRRHIGMVYQLCLVLLQNVPDAEDAAQNVFRKALERAEPFRDPEHERAWLLVTARNECRNLLRHWWRARRADSGALDTLTWEDPEESALWALIASLPERQRAALYLRYYQGYSAAEVASLMGKNPATVRTWLFRARETLKKLWEADNEKA